MVEFRGISPARQPQAIHVVPDTMPKTHSSFLREFHSLKHSEEHTADNKTYSIFHSAFNFISFPPFLNTLYAHTLTLYHTNIQSARVHARIVSLQTEKSNI